MLPLQHFISSYFLGRKMLFPDYIFETSWEVCNKVGGIYTVLSTRAKTLQEKLNDHIIFIGPDCRNEQQYSYFKSDDKLFADWRRKATTEGLTIKVGRWLVPGNPIAVLVDFRQFFPEKNHIYGKLWEDFQVDSLHAYGDYDDSSMFAYGAAKVVESFYRFYLDDSNKVVFHANEWQTGFAALVLRELVPQIATIFTTHATCIGRSIAGNNKPLYEYLWAYNGDQMAQELNIQSKHSIEKQTAHNVDCFTTVSDITATECRELLDKPADVVLPNGFENDFVPRGADFQKKRSDARRRLLDVARALTGTQIDNDALIVSTSGRYEFRNKGIDVFIEAMNGLNFDLNLKKQIVAFVEVPGWWGAPRKDLVDRLESRQKFDTPLDTPMLTHHLNNMADDAVMNTFRRLNIRNVPSDKVKLIFLPCYLNGSDGVLELDYYDALPGHDLCIYPSYYEPWGYTPLEAIAFKVPCITTDLAGFGLWANAAKGRYAELEDGVKVIHRTDYNHAEVVDEIKSTVAAFSAFSKDKVNLCRKAAAKLSEQALWSKFIRHYEAAYDLALQHAIKRVNDKNTTRAPQVYDL